MRSTAPPFGLSNLEANCLVSCYSDGRSEAEVAGWLGRPVHVVENAIRRAKVKCELAGVPAPRRFSAWEPASSAGMKMRRVYRPDLVG